MTEKSGPGRQRSAVVTGGASGIGRAVAALYAREGADVVVSHLGTSVLAAMSSRIYEETGPAMFVTALSDAGFSAATDLAVR